MDKKYVKTRCSILPNMREHQPCTGHHDRFKRYIGLGPAAQYSDIPGPAISRVYNQIKRVLEVNSGPLALSLASTAFEN
jgi:hypothetical protein